MIYVVYAIHIITCIFLILVVLLQQGKGADLSVFGGGTTQAAFGARGAATLLHKLTVGFFVLFMITTVSIGILQRGRRASSVMQGVDAPKDAAATTAPPAAPAAAPPAAAPPGAAAQGEAQQGVSVLSPPAESEVEIEAPADGGAPVAPEAAAPAPAVPAPPPAESGATGGTPPQSGSTAPPG